MKQVNTIALCFLWVVSCAKSISVGPDSETNWLTCTKLKDCHSDNAVACTEGLCVDAKGKRISTIDVSRVGATNDASEDEPVVALQIEGVWVFEHDPNGYYDAEHSGRADIVDGCLVVDNAVVIWHVSRRADVERVVSEVLSGMHPQIRLGGGGLSLSEGSTLDDFPAAVTEHCAVSEVWFAAPTPTEFLTDDSEDEQVALPSCTWPAELVDVDESTREVCSAGRTLLSCEMIQGTHICVSDNPISCPESSSLPGPSSCTNLCEPDEYVATCGGVGPGAVPDPPEGCRTTFTNPGGVSQHCCPCL